MIGKGFTLMDVIEFVEKKLLKKPKYSLEDAYYDIVRVVEE